MSRIEVAGDIFLRRPKPTHGCRAHDDDDVDDEKITRINNLFFPTIPRNINTLVPSLYQAAASAGIGSSRSYICTSRSTCA